MKGLFLGATTVLASVLVVACGGSPETRQAGTVDLAELRRAGAAPAYWLGERFEDLPLVANAGDPDRPTFVYGTCEVPPGSDGGCAPPLQLQHWPLAERPPGRFELAPGRRAACRLLGDGRITAAVFETTGGVELYLGERVVVVFGRRELIRGAMSDLRPIREQRPLLPRPPAWVVDELRRCAPGTPAAKLRELRASPGPRTYWVGPSFEGHPLASAEGDAEEVRLVYGECARDKLAFDAACWPPLEIRVGPTQSPAGYADSIECLAGDARGAPTALFPSAHTLDVFAGDRTIRLIGPDLDLLQRAANALRPLDESNGANGLPAPAPELVRAIRERCT